MIVVDTGILLAVANRNDRWHTRAVEVLVEHRAEMLVPAPVVIETAWLIARDLGNAAEASFVAAASRGEFRIVDLTAADYHRASEILTTYADSNFGLVDACVMAVAEPLPPARTTIGRETRLVALHTSKNLHRSLLSVVRPPTPGSPATESCPHPGRLVIGPRDKPPHPPI